MEKHGLDMWNNDTKTRKVYANSNKYALGKNGGYMPSSLDSRLISGGRQAMSETNNFAI